MTPLECCPYYDLEEDEGGTAYDRVKKKRRKEATIGMLPLLRWGPSGAPQKNYFFPSRPPEPAWQRLSRGHRSRESAAFAKISKKRQTKNGKPEYFGTFKSAFEAAKAYDARAREVREPEFPHR